MATVSVFYFVAYQRKTNDRPKFKAAWLKRRKAALIASGLTKRMLAVIHARDVEGLTLAQTGAKFGFSDGLAFQVYQRALRLLTHPRREHLLPPISPAFPGQIIR